MRRSAGLQGLYAMALATTLASGSAYAAPPSAKGPAPSTLEASKDVESAEQLYAKLDYEQANAVAERVVTKKGLGHDQLVRIYRVLAITYAVLDKEEQAHNAFLQLLTYDPEFQADPNLGPKVNRPFLDARGTFRSLQTVPGIAVVTSVSRDGGSLRVTTRDPTHIVKKVTVGYRWTSSGDYATAEFAARDLVTVEVGAAPEGRSRLDFYVQALDELDNAVFEAGTAAAPKSAFAAPGDAKHEPKAKSGSIFGKPVFWVVAGAAVVGSGAALFLALRPRDPTSASLSPIMLCGSERCN